MTFVFTFLFRDSTIALFAADEIHARVKLASALAVTNAEAEAAELITVEEHLLSAEAAARIDPPREELSKIKIGNVKPPPVREVHSTLPNNSPAVFNYFWKSQK